MKTEGLAGCGCGCGCAPTSGDGPREGRVLRAVLAINAAFFAVEMAAGAFQLVLAVAGFVEVLRRFATDAPMPDSGAMIAVAALALVANVVCLCLLRSTRSREAHMRASVIFSSNDVVINAGVIVAGILVKLLGSGYPDLVVGTVVFVVVARGAWRILGLARGKR